MVYSVYLAGSLPKGKEEEAKFTDWREGFHSLIAKMLSDQKINLKITCLDPNTAKYGSMPTEKFFGRDVHMIKCCDLILVDSREKMGIGTCQEFLVAKYYKKPVIAVSPKYSYYSKIIKIDSSENFHYKHPFLTATSDVIVDNFEDAAKIIIDHFSGTKQIIPKTIDIIEALRKDFEENFIECDPRLIETLKKLNE